MDTIAREQARPAVRESRTEIVEAGHAGNDSWRMSRHSKAFWIFMSMLCLADLAWARAIGFTVGSDGILGVVMVLALLIGIASSYASKPGERPQRLCALAHLGAKAIFSFAVIGVTSYLAVTIDAPLVDPWLSKADQFLGFDWLSWFDIVYSHPVLGHILWSAYNFGPWELGLLLILFPLSARSERTEEVLWCLIISSLIVIFFSALFPAVSAWVYYGVTDRVVPVHLPDFTALRNGSLRELHFGKTTGLVTFPSFHTALALLFVYFARRIRVLFPLTVIVSAMTLASVPTVGGHYVVDIFGGAVVTVLSVVVSRRLNRRWSTEPALSLAAANEQEVLLRPTGAEPVRQGASS